MRRTSPRYRDRDAKEDAGPDSFLDVVTNIVGILIILVMVIGARVRSIVPMAEDVPPITPLEEEVRSLGHTVMAAESEIEELQRQVHTVSTAAAMAGDTRIQLATAVSAAKAGLDALRQQGEATQVAAAEAVARTRSIEEQLERTDRELQRLAHAPATTQEVLAYPTPIGRTVTGEELHFRVSGGRVAYIPLDELFGLAKQQTQRRSGSLAEMASRVESVGPAQGFRLDYVIEAKVDQARGQVLIRSREWVVRPDSEPVGERVDEALAEHSRFRSVLAAARPETTVTFWCYPDSFAAYRQLRAEMHRLAVPTAARPLPEGAPIGGSTEGSKSVAH